MIIADHFLNRLPTYFLTLERAENAEKKKNLSELCVLSG